MWEFSGIYFFTLEVSMDELILKMRYNCSIAESHDSGTIVNKYFLIGKFNSKYFNFKVFSEKFFSEKALDLS